VEKRNFIIYFGKTSQPVGTNLCKREKNNGKLEKATYLEENHKKKKPATGYLGTTSGPVQLGD